MRLTNQHIKEARAAHDLYWESYLIGDVSTLTSLLDSHYTQIGSVENEVFFTKDDAVQFVKDTINQIVGHLEMRNRITREEVIGEFILIHEFCDLFVLTEEGWVFYSKFRASTLLKLVQESWKIIHQHSSLPDSKAQEGETLRLKKSLLKTLSSGKRSKDGL